mmetsp:Transcript_21123/g.54146  ORF Transcript_21123/g.54146 Transcript_21123/m.54146 type:complete len:247 (+) Transcript_21123:359-1099(+)
MMNSLKSLKVSSGSGSEVRYFFITPAAVLGVVPFGMTTTPLPCTRRLYSMSTRSAGPSSLKIPCCSRLPAEMKLQQTSSRRGQGVACTSCLHRTSSSSLDSPMRFMVALACLFKKVPPSVALVPTVAMVLVVPVFTFSQASFSLVQSFCLMVSPVFFATSPILSPVVLATSPTLLAASFAHWKLIMARERNAPPARGLVAVVVPAATPAAANASPHREAARLLRCTVDAALVEVARRGRGIQSGDE